MNKELFIKYIDSPNTLTNKTLKELRQIVEDYPYFQTAQILYAKNLHNLKDIKLDSQIKIASIYTNNREKLFYIINKSPLIIQKPEELVKDDVIIKDELVKTILPDYKEVEIIPESEEQKIEITSDSGKIEHNSIADEILERVQRIKESKQKDPEKQKNIESVPEKVNFIVENSEIKEVQPIVISQNVVWNIESVSLLMHKETLIDIYELINISEFVWNLEPLLKIQPLIQIKELLNVSRIVWSFEDLVLKEEISLIDISEILNTSQFIWNIQSVIELNEKIDIKYLLNISRVVWNIESLLELLVVESEPAESIINISDILNKDIFISTLLNSTINLAKVQIDIKIKITRAHFDKVYIEIPLFWNILVLEKVEEENSEFSFTEWLKIITNKQEVKQVAELQEDKIISRRNANMQLIDKFIEEEPRISPRLDTKLNSDKIYLSNCSENESFMTETLAGIYIKQEHYDKALKIYKKLSLKNPEKYAYFAIQIEKVQNLINQQ